MPTGKQSQRHKESGKSTSISNIRVYFGCECWLYYRATQLTGVQALKECVDEIDLGTQYHLSRYAFLCESIVLSDGTTLTPPDDSGTSSPHHCPRALMNCSTAMSGLKAALEAIDNRSDFKTFMQNYAFAHGGINNKGPRRDGPREEGFVRLL